MTTFAAISSDSLGTYIGSSARMLTLADNNSSKVTMAVNGANTEIRDALLTQYDADSVDAITASDCPAYIQIHACAIAMSTITAGQQPPDQFSDAAAAARKWLDAIRSGVAQVTELTLISSAESGATGAGDVRVKSPACRTFDTYDSDGYLTGYGSRDPSI